MHGLFFLAQIATPPSGSSVPLWLQWLFVIGDPTLTDGRVLGGLLTWCKVVGLFCLLTWTSGWLFRRQQTDTGPQRTVTTVRIYMTAAALLLGLLSALLANMEQTERLKLAAWGPFKPAVWIGLLAGLLTVVLIEWKLWSVMLRSG